MNFKKWVESIQTAGYNAWPAYGSWVCMSRFIRLEKKVQISEKILATKVHLKENLVYL